MREGAFIRLLGLRPDNSYLSRLFSIDAKRFYAHAGSTSRQGWASVAHVIFLHGASSSGKSTIAKALQARIELPFWHISIDHLRDAGVLPSARFKSGEFAWRDARQAFFNGFHASLAAYAEAGNHLILEHILDTPGWLEDLQKYLQHHDVLFVAVHCPVQLLVEREKQRGDRPLGSAEQDFATIHIGKIYDLELQSSDGVDVNADRILSAWRSLERSSSFTRQERKTVGT
jgi:chloramphenicol 3-O phosphotransferase